MVLIISGSKTVRKRRGFAVDFCPVCREVTAIRVIEIKVASHLYGVGLGSGRAQAFVSECTTCGFMQETDRTRFESLEKRMPESLTELEAKTNPRLRQDRASRLQLEDDIRAGTTLGEDERRELIREPFALIAEEVDVDQGLYKRSDSTSLWIAVGTFSLPFAFLIGAADSDDSTTSNILGVTGLALFATGLFTTLYRIGTRRGRFFRQKIRPMLDRALTPLNPSMDELDETIEWLRGVGFKIAKKFRAEEFRDRIQLLEFGPQGRGSSQSATDALRAPSRDQHATTTRH